MEGAGGDCPLGQVGLLLHELRVLSHLPPHKNVVAFYGHEVRAQDGVLALYLEHVRGGSLLDRFRRATSPRGGCHRYHDHYHSPLLHPHGGGGGGGGLAP
eukprot:749477-Prorocentrum_minimum.AAC.1